MRIASPLAILALGLSFVSTASGVGPADPLFRLLPPDAGLALAIENFRDHSREISKSPLAAGLRRLPAVGSWLGSEQIRGVRRVVRQVEEALDLKPGTIRDELFGDAVVLSLRAGPADAPEQSRGVLLGRARDRELLERLIRSMNEFQTDNGELSAVVRKMHGGRSYSVRTFAQAGRPDEVYATFEDGVFAWSNSEDLIREVLDRKAAAGPSLADDTGFGEVREALPAQSLMSLYLSPRAIEATMRASERKGTSGQERLTALFVRYVAALRYLGLAIEWRDGVAIHSHESIDPAKLDGWLRDWLTRPAPPGVATVPLPAQAIAACVLHFDLVAARDAAWGLIPERERPWYRNLKTAFQGLLMGQDFEADILPRLGPGVLLMAEAPTQVDSRTRLPLTAVIGIKPGPDAPGPGAAIENALRTGLSIYALDPAQKSADLRIETRSIGEAKVLVIGNARRTVLAIATTRDRIVFGNLAEAVARVGTNPSASSLEAIRAENFPDATTFAVVDLARLADAIRPLRRPIAERLAGKGRRGADDIGKDLDQIVAVADLFRAATFTSTTGRDATSIHRVARLIAR